jgi:hypothetical protein
MLPNSLRVRAVHFAFLFGPPRFVGREEASRVHGKVCDALGIDDIAFRYASSTTSEKPNSKGFSIVLERKEGRGSFAATLDNKNVGEPIRLLLTYTWPPSLEHANETFDMTAEAAFSALDGDWQCVLAEARLRAQCDVRGGNALTFMRQRLLRQADDWVSDLGTPVAFCGVKFEVAATPPGENPLDGAKRELAVELLREDPGGLYLELMSQWPQVVSMPSSQAAAADVRSIRQLDKKPSKYVADAFAYLQARVESLASAKGEL